MPYSILPAPVTDPYLADRRSRDILNVASSVGIQPGAEEQPQQAVDRFAQYANNFDVGIPELSSRDTASGGTYVFGPCYGASY
jgi:hypothetical protein